MSCDVYAAHSARNLCSILCTSRIASPPNPATCLTVEYAPGAGWSDRGRGCLCGLKTDMQARRKGSYDDTAHTRSDRF